MAGPPEPPLVVRVVGIGHAASKEGALARVTFELRSTRELGPVTVELLDHHRRAIATATRRVGAAPTRVTLGPVRAPADTADYEGIHLQVGDFHYFGVGTADPTEGEIPFGVRVKLAVKLGTLRTGAAAR